MKKVKMPKQSSTQKLFTDDICANDGVKTQQNFPLQGPEEKAIFRKVRRAKHSRIH